MHHLAINREVTSLPTHGAFRLRNPIPPVIRGIFRTRRPILNFRGTQLPESLTLRISKCTADERRLRVAGIRDIDIATFGNLCVDIVLNVPELPPEPPDQLKAYMDELSKTHPDKEYWEAGGNSNVAIAASRLGLCCTTIGHVGDDVYGRFFLDVLHNEGISMLGVNEKSDTLDRPCLSCETLLCWVLVDPLQRHGFCRKGTDAVKFVMVAIRGAGLLPTDHLADFLGNNRTDFTKDPIYSWMTELSAEVKVAIKRSKILFCNGYDFDEFSPRLLQSALDCAIEARTSIFFDPGPRVTLLSGKPEEQRVFELFLKMSDVLLLTSEEVALLTGIENPIRAGQELLKKGVHTRWVIVKMGAKGSILITTSSITCAPAFKVKVIDTVGCGDSFVAAIAYGFIHKAPLVHTLTLANAVGGATATGCGAGRNVATLEQVIQLAKRSNIDEDVKLWEELLGDNNLGAPEVNLLSGLLINSQHLNIVPLHKVVSELLSSKLQPTQSTIALASSPV